MSLVRFKCGNAVLTGRVHVETPEFVTVQVDGELFQRVVPKSAILGGKRARRRHPRGNSKRYPRNA